MTDWLVPWAVGRGGRTECGGEKKCVNEVIVMRKEMVGYLCLTFRPPTGFQISVPLHYLNESSI